MSSRVQFDFLERIEDWRPVDLIENVQVVLLEREEVDKTEMRIRQNAPGVTLEKCKQFLNMERVIFNRNRSHAGLAYSPRRLYQAG